MKRSAIALSKSSCAPVLRSCPPSVVWTAVADAVAAATAVVVEWLYYSKRIIIVRWADLSDFFSSIFVGKMCIFVSSPMKIATFLWKNGYHQTETKSWKSSMILTKKVTTTTVNPRNRGGF